MGIKYRTTTKRKIEIARRCNTLDQLYAELVEDLVADRYSLKQEIACLRQRDTKPDNFNAYNAYVEECKTQVKTLLGIN